MKGSVSFLKFFIEIYGKYLLAYIFFCVKNLVMFLFKFIYLHINKVLSDIVFRLYDFVCDDD